MGKSIKIMVLSLGVFMLTALILQPNPLFRFWQPWDNRDDFPVVLEQLNAMENVTVHVAVDTIWEFGAGYEMRLKVIEDGTMHVEIMKAWGNIPFLVGQEFYFFEDANVFWMCSKADEETEWTCEQQDDNFMHTEMPMALRRYVNLLKYERLNEVGFDISSDQYADIYTAKPWYLTDLATADLLHNPVGWHEYPDVQHFIIINHADYIQVSQRFIEAKNYRGFHSEDVFYRDRGKTTIVLPDFGLDE